MLKVWGRKNSINVQKVLWCCGELGLDYERIDAGGAFGGTRNPEYLAINPNGLVPTISDDGFTLWESNTIVRYLAVKHGVGTLYPEGLQRRDEASIELFRQQTVEAWRILEKHLEGREYAPDDTLTMADIPLGVSVHR